MIVRSNPDFQLVLDQAAYCSCVNSGSTFSLPLSGIQYKRQRRDGLTLLELLMVLVILAIVSTVALSSLQPRIEQQRFETAQNLLNQVTVSVIGPKERYQIDKTPLISGFVADVGRLPLISLVPKGVQKLNDPVEELWSNQTLLATSFPFQIRSGPKQPIDCSDINIPCGWRGPYLQLAPGNSMVKDPWGVPLQAEVNSRNQVAALKVQVPGAISEQISLPQNEFETPQSPGSDSLHTLSARLDSGLVTVTGRVVGSEESTVFKAFVVLPDPEVSTATLIVREDEDQNSQTFTFHDVPIGLRAVVVQHGGKLYKKYIQVTHQGADVTFDLKN